MSNKGILGHSITLDADLTPEDQIGSIVDVNNSLTSLSEGDFGVDRLDHAPQIYQVINGERQSIHLLLSSTSGYYRLAEMTNEVSADHYRV